MSEFSASCSCGAIRCTIASAIDMVVNCHCTMCRKMNGSAFSSMAVVPSDSVRFATGEELLGAYALTESVTKRFCKLCGTPVFNANARFPGLSMFFLGAIDQSSDLSPAFNAFCSTKLAWVDGIAALTSFESSPDGS